MSETTPEAQGICDFDRVHFAKDGRGDRAVFLDGTEVRDVLAAYDGGNEEGWVEVVVKDEAGRIMADGDRVKTVIRTGMVRVVSREGD